MINRKGIFILLTLNLFLITGLAAEKTKSENEERVQAYVVAFNNKDVESMLEMVTEDVQWIYITGDKLTVEAKGKPALRKSLTGYFRSAPKVESKLEWLSSTSSRVAALERVSWRSNQRSRSQSSLSVYEFVNGKISRIYYYPSEK